MALPYVTTTQLQKVLDKMDYIRSKLNTSNNSKSSAANAVSIYKLDLSDITLPVKEDEDVMILEDATELYNAVMSGTPLMFTNISWTDDLSGFDFVFDYLGVIFYNENQFIIPISYEFQIPNLYFSEDTNMPYFILENRNDTWVFYAYRNASE